MAVRLSDVKDIDRFSDESGGRLAWVGGSQPQDFQQALPPQPWATHGPTSHGSIHNDPDQYRV